MTKLEGFELLAHVEKVMTETVGKPVRLIVRTFNQWYAMEHYLDGVYIDMRKFTSYEDLEAHLLNMLENCEKGD